MNPYRIKGEKQHIADEPPRYEDDILIIWVWFGIGAIMIIAGAMQPSPSGPRSSLGMLLSALAGIALWRHYVAKWNARRKSTND